ncbi:glucosyltransferase [Lunasporangiospora selenospora]|uniref:Dol-P-Glc:Glc(2)Man(9)GlcNAc(2)-PP-Dol alpha-1,2-glucosyltransferase n=1 Tax=Lunasporangiospora selenospora TaxID=979761 RepID=A0A9P6KI69_9FUNG|nr:glucosyltransferase [Lunasporangiospora selenospora]
MSSRPFCSTLLLRLTNLLYPLLILYAVSSLLGRLHSHLTAQERLTSAAVILFFPNLWFYNFLYYTDGGSVAFVLLSWLSAKRRRHLLAALFSAIALTFRQTNIIWSLFILGTSLLDLANPTERRQFDPKAAFIRSFSDVLMAVVGFIGMLWQKLFVAVTMTLPYIGLLAGFAAFVHWNGGIVLATEQTVLWIVIYMVATVLTLIPSPLLEFRYFIMPYMIYRIAMRQPRGSWLMLEFLVYLALNVFTVAMFLYKPFRWPHEEGLQRFMW